MKRKDRLKGLYWLAILSIWRISTAIFRAVILFLFFIPMLFSNSLYEIISTFIYETIEDDEYTETAESEGKSLECDIEFQDNESHEVFEEIH